MPLKVNDTLKDLISNIVTGDIEVVDLSQELNEETPVIALPEPFKTTGGFKYNRLSKYDEDGPGWYWNDFVAGEHVGTHFDAPNHWVSGKGKNGVDTMPVKNMIAEACVINVTQESFNNADYCLTIGDILAYEEKFGKIQPHSWVIMHTGWGNYSKDHEKYFNVGEDGMSHTPGIGKEASIFLAEERDVLGVGVETVGTDAGIAATFDPMFPNHHYMHGANKYGLAQLANVDKLPARGAVIITNPLKITGGSGSPLRVIALVPKN